MSFDSHFSQPSHNGFTDCEFTLIVRSDDVQSLLKREIFWQEKLGIFLPNGLNEREVAFEL